MIFNISEGALKTPELNASYPANATVKAGTNATFKVEVSKAGIPSTYTYQWYVNDVAVSGATGASYTRSTSSDKGAYSVYCKVTNKAGTVVSRTATLTVNKAPVLNTSYPANATVVKGNSVTSKVTISTAGYPTSYTYQWYKNGSAVSGATSSTYTFTPTEVGTTTLYCKVTNAAGSVNSRTATITATRNMLYNAGDEYTSVTGGWDSTGYSASGVTVKPATKNADNIYLTGTSSTCQVAGTQELIDLTNVNTLYFDINVTAVGSYFVAVSVGKSKSVTSVTSEVKIKEVGDKTTTLDVSSLTGTYYIAVRALSKSEAYFKRCSWE